MFGKDKVKGKWNWGDHVLPIVRPKLQTKPFGEIWAWSFCKVGVINVSLVGGTRSLACPFLDIQSNSFKKSGILNLVQVYRQRKVWKRVVDDIFESLELGKGEWLENISIKW